MSELVTIGHTTLYNAHDSSASEGEDGVFTASLSWRLKVKSTGVSFANLTADRVVAPFVSAGYLPKRGSLYGSTVATCRSVSASLEMTAVYTYTAQYSSKNADQEGDEKATDVNPLNDKPIVTWNASVESIAIHKDRDNEPILNKAGDPIIETKDDNKIGCTVKSNVALLPEWILDYRNSTNDEQITVGGLTLDANVARFVLPSGFLSELKSRNGINYYEFTYELLFDEQDKHHGRPINAGLREIYDNDGTPTLRNITNEDGTEINDVVPLDNDGAKIPNPTPENTVLLTVKKYYEKDFSVLPGIS